MYARLVEVSSRFGGNRDFNLPAKCVDLVIEAGSPQTNYRRYTFRLYRTQNRAVPVGSMHQFTRNAVMHRTYESTNAPNPTTTLERIYPYLYQGETGTGKELIDKAIHTVSSRVDHPFVVVDCAARYVDGERTLRSRMRRLHGRRQETVGSINRSGHRHHLSRRNHRSASYISVQLTAPTRDNRGK